MAQTKKIFIIAGTYAEARKFAKDNMLSENKWVHLCDPVYLKGVWNPRVFRIGTWEKLNPEVLNNIENEIIERTKRYVV